MRMVVDLPAPLLPRKPKISPRATSKLTSSTATNWPKRRVRLRTTIATCAGAGRRRYRPRARSGALRRGGRSRRARVRSSSACSRAICASSTSVLSATPCAVALVDDALGLGGRADLVVRDGDGFPAGVELQHARAHFEACVWRSKSSTRVRSADALARASPCLGGAAAAVPQRPRQVDRGVPGGRPVAAARKDARVGARVVVAAAHRDLRPRAGGDAPRRADRRTRRAAPSPAAPAEP